MDEIEYREKIDYYLISLQNNNNEALNDLYDLTNKQLYVLCYSYFKNREDSEDALFDSYLKIKKEIHRFNGSNGFNWMYTITKNICLNQLKKQKHHELLEDEISDTSTIENSNDESSIILEIAKEILNEHEFRVLILHAVDCYKFKDIAKITNSLEATVRWQYNNALKKVKKEYEKKYEEK